MSGDGKGASAGSGMPLRRAFARTFLGVLLIEGALGILLFVPAGTLEWTDAWLLLAAYGVFLCAYGIRSAMRDPEQLRERAKRGANTKPWDRTILSLYSILLLVLFPVCGLDAVRYRAFPLPPGLKIMGWAGMALAGALILRVLAANTFASRTARIQDDRGQTVVSGGPYRLVRHPMYLGIILLFLCVPLALGSGWGLIPAAGVGVFSSFAPRSRTGCSSANLPATRNSRAARGSGCCRESGEGAGAGALVENPAPESDGAAVN
jgi:protein-S-isoprenylcysteine O-methyltransferase Ste14